jgi:HemY protein
MINLLLLVLFLACLGITAGWIAENPGNVTIYWFDYRVDTSFAFLLLLGIAAAFVLSYAYIFVRRVVLSPGDFLERRSIKHYRKGLTELTFSVAALAAADVKKAEAHTRKAEALLGRTPMTLLLSAQIARSQGDDARTRILLDQMLDYKETEYIAARSLSDAAKKQQIFPEALQMAERAHAINPKEIKSLLSLHVRMGHWQEAQASVQKSLKRRSLTRAEAKHFRGLLYLMQGMQLLATEQHEGALKAASLCLGEIPDFIPAILFAAKAYHANQQEHKALALIRRTWARAPHAQLGALYLSIISSQPKDAQMKLVNKLTGMSPDSIESELLQTQAAINNRQWDVAYKTLNKIIVREESVRACRMMAAVEQGLSSDPNAGGKWFTRSQAAQPDPEWTCMACGHATEAWDIHCPACGSFDTQEWKKRQIKFAAA